MAASFKMPKKFARNPPFTGFLLFPLFLFSCPPCDNVYITLSRTVELRGGRRGEGGVPGSPQALSLQPGAEAGVECVVLCGGLRFPILREDAWRKVFAYDCAARNWSPEFPPCPPQAPHARAAPAWGSDRFVRLLTNGATIVLSPKRKRGG